MHLVGCFVRSLFFVFQPNSAWKWSHNLHETYQLSSVQYITPDDGHRRCPKHVEFYDKINFGYLMHLVGCFVRSLFFVFQPNSAWKWSHNLHETYQLPSVQ